MFIKERPLSQIFILIYKRAQHYAAGGQRCADLVNLTDLAKHFNHVFGIIGDNDVKWKSVDYMLEQYVQLIEAVRHTKVQIAGIMRRKDLSPVIVAEYNINLNDGLEEIPREAVI